jgi:hypothetical protein
LNSFALIVFGENIIFFFGGEGVSRFDFDIVYGFLAELERFFDWEFKELAIFEFNSIRLLLFYSNLPSSVGLEVKDLLIVFYCDFLPEPA